MVFGPGGLGYNWVQKVALMIGIGMQMTQSEYTKVPHINITLILLHIFLVVLGTKMSRSGSLKTIERLERWA